MSVNTRGNGRKNDRFKSLKGCSKHCEKRILNADEDHNHLAKRRRRRRKKRIQSKYLLNFRRYSF